MPIRNGNFKLSLGRLYYPKISLPQNASFHGFACKFIEYSRRVLPLPVKFLRQNITKLT